MVEDAQQGQKGPTEIVEPRDGQPAEIIKEAGLVPSGRQPKQEPTSIFVQQ
jgi:hypothetical protein